MAKSQNKPHFYVINYLIPFGTFLLGLIASYLFTLHGHDLSYPPYPNLDLDYQNKNIIYIEMFNQNNTLSKQNNSIHFNPYSIDVPIRFINNGRPTINEIIVMLWGDQLYYSPQIVSSLKGKDNYQDITLPLIFRCTNKSKSCNLDDIPLGKRLINIYVLCTECSTPINNYLIEFCIYDNLNVTSLDCIQKLNYFPE